MNILKYLCLWFSLLHAAENAPPLPGEKGMLSMPALTALIEDDQYARKLTNKLGENYLHFACRTGNLPLVQLLLYCNFPLHEQDTCGRTALYYALRGEYDAFQSGKPRGPAISLLLLEKGHTPFYCEPAQTPLMLAAMFGLHQVAEKLLQLGAPVNCVEEKSGYTALTYAAQQNKPAIAKLLLHYGADIHAGNPKKTALAWALEWQDKELPELHTALQTTKAHIPAMLGTNPLIFLALRELKPMRHGRLKHN